MFSFPYLKDITSTLKEFVTPWNSSSATLVSAHLTAITIHLLTLIQDVTELAESFKEVCDPVSFADYNINCQDINSAENREFHKRFPHLPETELVVQGNFPPPSGEDRKLCTEIILLHCRIQSNFDKEGEIQCFKKRNMN